MFPTFLPGIGQVPQPVKRTVICALRMCLVALTPLSSACVARTPSSATSHGATPPFPTEGETP